MLKMIVRNNDGSLEEIAINQNMKFVPEAGQQFYFSDAHSNYTFNLTDGEKSVKIFFKEGNETFEIIFDNLAELIKQNNPLDENAPDTVLGVANDKEGFSEIFESLNNKEFNSGEIIDHLKEVLAESNGKELDADKLNGIIIDDFGSLASNLDAAAAGGPQGDGSTFNAFAFNDSDEVNAVDGAGSLDVGRTAVGESSNPNGGNQVNITLTATTQITENDDTITYTATLDTPAVTDMTITLSNGSSIFIEAGDTIGSIVSEITPDPDVYKEADTTVTVSVTGVEGGGFDNIDNGGPASTTVVDTIDTTTVEVTTADVNEDADSVTFNFQTSNVPQTGETATLTITLNGVEQTVTLDANGKGTLVVDTKDSDVYNDSQEYKVIVTEINGGNFEDTSVVDANATANVTDTGAIDTTTVEVTTADVNEDADSVTFNFQTSNVPQTGETATLTITLNGVEQTVTLDANGKGTLVVDTKDSDVYNDSQEYKVIVTEINGGNFEDTSVVDANATANVTDTGAIDTTTVEVTTADVNEDADSVTFNFQTSNVPQTGETATLTITLNGVEQTVTLDANGKGTLVVDTKDSDVYNDSQEYKVIVTEINGGNFEDTSVVDANATANVTDTGAIDTTTVEVTTADVNEDADSVTFNFQTSNVPQTGETATLTITLNGVEQTVTLDANGKGTLVVDTKDSDVYNDSQEYKVIVTEINGGNFEDTSVVDANATANVTDTGAIDTTTVEVTTADVNEDADSVTFNFQTSNVPQTGETATLTITLNGVEQTVTLDANGKGTLVVDTKDSDVYNDSQEYKVIVTEINGGNFEDTSVVDANATANVTDTGAIDTTTVEVTTADVNEDADSVTFNFQTSNVPQTGETATLTITLNGVEQTVTLDANGKGTLVVDTKDSDVYNDSQEYKVIVTEINGGNFEDTSVVDANATANVTDTGAIDTTTVEVTTADVNEDADSVTFNFQTSNVPQTGETATLTITLNGVEQTVTLDANGKGTLVVDTKDSDVYNDSQEYKVIVTEINGGNFEDTSVVDANATANVTDTGAIDTTTVEVTTADVNEDADSVTFNFQTSNVPQTGETATLTITLNGVEQTVTLDANGKGTLVVDTKDSDVYNDSQEYKVIVTEINGGNFEDTSVVDANATANVTDTGAIDTTTVEVTTADVNEDADSVTFNFQTSNVPQTGETATLTITLNGVEQTVTLDANGKGTLVVDTKDSDVYNDSQEYKVIVTEINGGNFEDTSVVDANATANVTDTGAIDTTTVEVTTADVNEDADSVTFNFQTSNVPQTGETATLTITLNGVEQTVTLDANGKGTLVVDTKDSDVYNDSQEYKVIVTEINGGNFEDTSVVDANATANVTDTGAIDTTTVEVTTADVNEDADSVTFNFQTSNVPQTGETATLTITLNGVEQTVTLDANGKGTLVVDTKDSDVYNDSQEYKVIVTEINGGNFEDTSVVDANATANVTDTGAIDTTTVEVTTADVNEDADSVTFNFQTSNVPQTGETATLTITLNGVEQTVTLDANGKGTLVVDTKDSDVYNDSQEYKVIVTEINGGNFEDTSVVDANATANVTDTGAIDTTTVEVTTADVNEDADSVTFNFQTSNVPQTGETATLTITLNGVEQTVTLDANGKGTLVVDTKDSDVYNDSQEYKVIVTEINGGNFEDTSVVDANATANVTDTGAIDTTTVEVTTADVNEDADSVTFNFQTSNVPQTGETATLTITLNGVEQTVTLDANGKGTLVVDTKDSDVYNDSQEYKVIVTEINGGNFEDTSVVDANATANVTDTGAIDTTTVEVTTADVNEDADSVTFNFQTSNVPQTGETATLTITLNGVEQTVTLDANGKGTLVVDTKDSDVYNDSQEYKVIVTEINGGNFEDTSVVDANATANVTDTGAIDTTTVEVTTADVNEDADSVTFNFQTSNVPQTGETATLTITLNGVEQTVTLDANGKGTLVVDTKDSDVYNDSQEYKVIVTEINGGNFEDTSVVDANATANVTDTGAIDTTTVEVTTADVNEDADSVTFNFQTSNVPQTGETATLTITLNGVEQTVTLDANGKGTLVVDTKDSDVYNDSQEYKVIVTEINGGNFEDTSVVDANATANVTDTGAIDTTTVEVTTADVNEDADSVTFNFQTSNVPQTGETATLTITLNGVEQTVTLDANGKGTLVVDTKDSDVYNDSQEYKVIVTEINGGNFEDTSVVDANATANVTDTGAIDTTTVEVTTADVNEDADSVTFNFQTSNVPQTGETATLTITLNGVEQTVTLDANGKGTLVVDTKDSDVYNDSQEYKVIVTEINGGNFEDTSVVDANATANVTDTGAIDTTTVEVTTADVNEDADSVTFNFQTSNVPQTGETATLTITLNGVEQTVTLDANGKGTLVVDTKDSDVYNDSQEYKVIVTEINGGNFEDTSVVDANATANVTDTGAIDTTTVEVTTADVNEDADSVTFNFQTSNVPQTGETATLTITLNGVEQTVTLDANGKGTLVVDTKDSDVYNDSQEYKVIVTEINGGNFEDTSVVDANATANVTDTGAIDTTTVEVTTADVNEDADSVTFNFQTSNVPQTGETATLTITLNGVEQTVTLDANGKGTLVVDTKDSDVYNDSQEYKVIVTEINGGNFEDTSVVDANATANVTDTGAIDTTTVEVTTADVNEDADSVTFNFQTSNVPQTGETATLTITLNGVEQTVTLDANGKGTLVVDTKDSDVYNDSQEYKVIVTEINGGNFEDTSVVDANATANVTDTGAIDTTTVEVTTADVNEDADSVTFNFQTSNVPQTGETATLTITLNGVEQTVTLDANGKGTLVVDTKDSDVYNDSQEYKVIVTEINGGNFEDTSVVDANATANVTDTGAIDTTTVEVTTADVNEDADSVTFNFQTSNVPQTGETATLTITLNGVEQTVTLDANGKGTLVVDTKDSDVYNDSQEYKVIVTEINGGNFEDTSVVDANATANVTDTGAIDTTTVEVTTADVNEDADSVTFNFQTSNVPQTGETATLTITLNGVEQTVTLDANGKGTLVVDTKDSDVYNDSQEYKVIVTEINGGNFEDTSVVDANATANVTDTGAIDTTTVEVTTADVNEDADSVTFNFQTSNVPQTGETATLTITLNGVEQTVTLDANGKGTLVVDTKDSDVYNDSQEYKVIVTEINGGNFEDTSVVDANATANVTDTGAIDTTTVEVTTADVNEDADSVTFNFQTSNVPQTGETATLTITLNGVEQTVTLDANGKGTLVVDTKDSDVYNDSQEYKVIVTEINGGNFEDTSVVDANATANVTDTGAIDTTTVEVTTADVNEDADSVTFNFQTSNVPQTGETATLTITLNGVEQTVTLDANGKGTLVVDTKDSDVYNDSQEYKVIVTEINGGNFEDTSVVDANATANVTDTGAIDTTTVEVTTADVNEDADSVTFNFQTSNVPQTGETATLTITLNGVEQTVTLDANGKGTLVVDTKDSDVYNDSQEYKVIVTEINGGNFEDTSVVDANATANVTDTGAIDTTTVEVTTADVNEDADSVTFNFQTSNVPQTGETATLTITLNGVEQTVTLDANGKGTLVVDTKDSDVYNDSQEYKVIVTEINGGNFEDTSVVDANATANVTDTGAIDTTTVEVTTADVNEDADSVTFNFQTSNVPQTGETATLTITLNGVEQTVTLDANGKGTLVVDTKDSDVYNDSQEYKVIVTEINGGNFEDTSVVDANATANVTDTGAIDTTTVEVTTADVNEDADSVTFNFQTSNVPQTGETATLTITLNGVEQTVTLDANGKGTLVVDTKDSDVYNDSQEYKVIVTEINGGNFEDTSVVDANATANVTDTGAIDTTTVEVTTADVNEDADSVTFNFQTSNVPQTGETATLTITLNGVEQTVTLDANGKGTLVVDTKDSDVYNDSQEYKVIVTEINGGNFEDTSVVDANATANVTDTGAIDTTTVEIIGDSTIEEGNTATYHVSVEHPTATDMSVTVVTGYIVNEADEHDITPIVETVIIKAGDTIPKDDNGNEITIEVNTTNNTTYEGSEDFKVSISETSGGGFEDVVISNSIITTITDENDISVKWITQDIKEEGSKLYHTVTMDAPASIVKEYAFVIGGGTATSGTDYNPIPEFTNGVTYNPSTGNITVPAGVTNFSIVVSSLDDSSFEPTESYNISIDGVGTVGRITDNETFTITTENGQVDEDALVNTSDDDSYDPDVKEVSGTITTNAQDSVNIIFSDSQTASLSSGGESISITVSPDGKTLVGKTADNTEIFEITIDENNEYQFELKGPVDHLDPTSEDLLSNIGFNIQADNLVTNTSTTGTINISIADDIPSIVEPSVTDSVATDIPEIFTGVVSFTGSGGYSSGYNFANGAVLVSGKGFTSSTNLNLTDANLYQNSGGLGVASVSSPYHNLSSEVDFRKTKNGQAASEELVVELEDGKIAYGAKINFNAMYGGEAEVGVAEFYRDGILVSTQTFSSNASNGDYAANFNVSDGGFDKIIIKATDNGNSAYVYDNSDFAVSGIEFTGTSEPQVISYAEGTISHNYGADGAGSLSLTGILNAVTLANGAVITDITTTNNSIIAKDDLGNLVFQVQLTPATGKWELFQYQEFTTNNINSTELDFNVKIVDGDGDSDNAIVGVNMIDNSPTSTNDDITIIEDEQNPLHLVTVNDFGTYSDNNTDHFTEVQITRVPTNGDLLLNGEKVEAGDKISYEDIDGGNLKFKPTLHTDDDSSFEFKVSDGISFSNDSYTTTVNVTAVADAPITSISVSEARFIDGGTTELDNKTESINNINTTLGHNRGDNVITGTEPVSKYDETVSKTLDFGAEYAGQTVKIAMNVSISGSWNHSPRYYDDNWGVSVNGEKLAVYKYSSQNGYAPNDNYITVEENGVTVYKYGNAGENSSFTKTHVTPELEVTLDENGRVVLEFGASTTEKAETVTINSVTGVFDGGTENHPDTYEYDVNISAALVDTDGSETLTVEITGVPVGATLENATYNPTTGNWVITVGEDIESITDTLKLTVPSNADDFTLGIKAIATEDRDNSSAESIDNATVQTNEAPISEDVDVELNNAKIRLDEAPEYGTIRIKVDGNWQDMAIGQEYDKDSEVKFIPDSTAIENATNDIEVGTFNANNPHLSDWGTVQGKTASFEKNGVTITTTSSDGDLTLWDDDNTKTHLGVGIGDNDGNGLSRSEYLTITIDGENVNQISFTLSGLGSYFDKNDNNETKVEIIAYDKDGQKISTQTGFRESNYSEDEYIFSVNNNTPTPIAYFTLGTAYGNGSYVVQNMTLSRTVYDDVVFTTIQPDGSEEQLRSDLNLLNSNANNEVILDDSNIVVAQNDGVEFTLKNQISDIEDDSAVAISNVKITELPEHGTLTLEDGTVVTLNTEYSKDTIFKYTSDGTDSSVGDDIKFIAIDTEGKQSDEATVTFKDDTQNFESILSEDIDLDNLTITDNTINLENTKLEDLNIDLDDIVNLESEKEYDLKIFGDEGDSVSLEGGDTNWTKQDGVETIDGQDFNVYQGTDTSGTSNIKILIDTDVSIESDI